MTKQAAPGIASVSSYNNRDLSQYILNPERSQSQSGSEQQKAQQVMPKQKNFMQYSPAGRRRPLISHGVN